MSEPLKTFSVPGVFIIRVCDTPLCSVQVWAISCEDRGVYFRQGVTASELSGKTWKAISVPRDGDRSHSSASVNSVQRCVSPNQHKCTFISENAQISFIAKNTPNLFLFFFLVSFFHSAGCFFSGEVQDQSGVDVESDVEKGSADGAFGLMTWPESSADTKPTSDPPVETPKPRIPKVTSDSFISELVSDREPGKTPKGVESTGPAAVLEEEEEEEAVPGEGDVKVLSAGAACSPSQDGGAPDLQWSNVDLEETQAHQTAAVPDVADSCSLSSVATYTLAMEDPYGADEHPLWAWVSGGGCSLDSHTQLSWFICPVNASCKFREVQRAAER